MEHFYCPNKEKSAASFVNAADLIRRLYFFLDFKVKLSALFADEDRSTVLNHFSGFFGCFFAVEKCL